MPLRRPVYLRRRMQMAMTGPAMPSRMPKEQNPNLMSMLRNNSTSRRARSESTILSANTLKSSGGRPELNPNWRMNKLIMKFTRT